MIYKLKMLKKLAKIKYLPNNFEVIQDGDHVVCALTGKKIPFVNDTGELVIICVALIGSGLGFLWYNAPPAMVFMGDTGSLSMGGAIGSIAVATKHEVILSIIGGIFVLEALSVFAQVISFKLTGKRIFRMAPIHHHFEQKGWSESTIVIRFWIIAIILALLGLASLKLR